MAFIAFGCSSDSVAPSDDAQQSLAGEWHEDSFARALVLGADGQALSAGLDCGLIEDTLGIGTWEAHGTVLTLNGLSGTLWWPGGQGLGPRSSASFTYEQSGTALTLLPDSGDAVGYTLAGYRAATPCAAGSELRLLFPRGGEVFTRGDSVRIRWRAGQVINSVQVEFSSDAGESFWIISGRAIPTRDSTWLDWEAEPFDESGGQCMVRVFDYSSRDLGFSASRAFEIR